MENKCYNRITKQYRVKRNSWNQDGSINSHTMLFDKNIYDSLDRKVPIVGYSNFWFVDYPYTWIEYNIISLLYKRFRIKFIRLKNWLITDENIKWFITTVLFVFINITGWLIAIYVKCH